jgi:hypothetical protein
MTILLLRTVINNTDAVVPIYSLIPSGIFVSSTLTGTRCKKRGQVCFLYAPRFPLLRALMNDR